MNSRVCYHNIRHELRSQFCKFGGIADIHCPMIKKNEKTRRDEIKKIAIKMTELFILQELKFLVGFYFMFIYIKSLLIISSGAMIL